MSEQVLSSARKAMENCFLEAVGPCLSYADTEQVSEATRSARQAQLLGADPDVFNPFDPDYACDEISGVLTWTEVKDVHVGSSYSYQSTGTLENVRRRCGSVGGTDTFTHTWIGSGSGPFPPPFPGSGSTVMYLHRETDTLFNLGSFSIRIREVHTFETCRGEPKVKDGYVEDNQILSRGARDRWGGHPQLRR